MYAPPPAGGKHAIPSFVFSIKTKLTKKVPLAEIAKINLEKVTPVAGSNLLSEKVS